MKLIPVALVAIVLVVACSSAETLTTSTPMPTLIPTQEPIQEEPTPEPTQEPTATATLQPTEEPTPSPIPEPTPSPKPRFFLNVLQYDLPAMRDVEYVTLTYDSFNDRPLKMDVFYPVDSESQTDLPVVVFVIGIKTSAMDLRNNTLFDSWGRLVAANGMVGVTYDTEKPLEDLKSVIGYLVENADELNIDPGRIGLWSNSSNTLTALGYAMQETEDVAKFLVLYYGSLLAPDDYLRDEFERECVPFGCLDDDLVVEQIRTDLPLYIVKAGKDQENTNASIDHFMELALEVGAEVVYVEHEDGRHAFDMGSGDERSVEIIIETLSFMKEQLGVE